MKEFLNSIKRGFLGSFNNEPVGWSGKKLTAFAITICCVAAHIKWMALKDFTQLTTVLTIDYAFIATLFGINVVDKMKNPSETKQDDTAK